MLELSQKTIEELQKKSLQLQKDAESLIEESKLITAFLAKTSAPLEKVVIIPEKKTRTRRSKKEMQAVKGELDNSDEIVEAVKTILTRQGSTHIDSLYLQLKDTVLNGFGKPKIVLLNALAKEIESETSSFIQPDMGFYDLEKEPKEEENMEEN